MTGRDWLLLLAGVLLVLLAAVFFLAPGPAAAQACADPIYVFSPADGHDGPAVTYLGTLGSRGPPVFLLVADDGAWQLVAVRTPELACELAGGAGPGPDPPVTPVARSPPVN